MDIFLFVTFAAYFLAVLRRPHWGIYLILALLPSYQIRFTIFGIPATFLEMLILILAAVTALHLVIAWVEKAAFPLPLKNWVGKFSWLLVFALCFLLAGAISSLVSPVTFKALGVFKAYFAEGFVFWLLFLIHIDTKAKLGRCFAALGVLVIGLALFGLYQFFTLYRLPPAWWGPGLEPRRVVSLYTYPNAVALLVAPILSLFTALLIFRNSSTNNTPPLKVRGGGGEILKPAQNVSKTFIITVLSLGLVSLILTFSRGGWIGYGLSVLFLTLFSQFRKHIATALIVGLMVILLIPATRQRLLPAFTGSDPAGQERIKLWQAAGQIIKTEPVLGGGLMGFREWYGALKPNNADDVLNYPHNFFLNFWTETGLLGLLAILGMVAWTFWEGWKILKTQAENQTIILAVFAAWIALLGHGLLDAPFFKNDLAILFWFLLAIVPVLKLSSCYENQREF